MASVIEALGEDSCGRRPAAKGESWERFRYPARVAFAALRGRSCRAASHPNNGCYYQQPFDEGIFANISTLPHFTARVQGDLGAAGMVAQDT